MRIPLRRSTGNLVMESRKHNFTVDSRRFACFSLQFDLSEIPAGSRVVRAELRLAKVASHAAAQKLHFDLTNLNRGARVQSALVMVHDEVDKSFMITRWQEAKIEDDLWAPASDGEEGLDHYEYRMTSGTARKRYIDILKGGLNKVMPFGVARAEPWDVLDVTDFVAAEAAGDRSITLFFSPSGSEEYMLRWHGAGSGKGTAPALVVSCAAPGAVVRATALEPGTSEGAAPAGIEERLRTLTRLRDEGLITEEEYRAKRKRLIDEF